MFPAQLIAHVPYTVIAALVGIVLVVVYEIDREENHMIMDMPLINMGSQNIFVLSFGYCVGKLPPDFMGFPVIYLSRLKGLYQMVGEIVPLVYGLGEGKAELNVCRFIGAAKGGHKHFFISLCRILDIVKGFV